jgi:regulator of nucleoside diphosphate kinase
MSQKSSRPPIVIAETEVERLDRLARRAVDSNPEVAEELMIELERAQVCSAPAVPDNVVRMNSLVEFQTDAGSRLTLRLVYPEDANIAGGRISVLTPVGAALIGLSVGQLMTWKDLMGRDRTLKIISVQNDLT